MELKPAKALGRLAELYRMPEEIVKGSDEAKKAWASGVFMGAVSENMLETKEITVKDREKIYERLEIHNISPQMYAVLRGSVAVPVALHLYSDSVTFYEVDEGEAVILHPKTWHGGAVGISTPATVLVVLRKGTTETDTEKSHISSAVRFTLCSY